jgi:deoxycytidine triphosphate deaminase
MNGININPKTVLKNKIITNLVDKKQQIQQIGIDLTLKEKIIIKPKNYVNVLVNEQFNMQNNFGLIIIRSSLSRQGIFCTSGVYDPNFIGLGGVSIYNLGTKTIKLEKDFRIGQIICFKANKASNYNGYYNKNKTYISKYDDKKDVKK